MQRFFSFGAVLGVLVSGIAHADAEVATQQLIPADITVSTTEIIHQDTCIQRDDEGRFLGWIDNKHCFLSSRATQTAQWLDGLFGQDHEEGDALVKSRIRIINDFSWFESSGLSANTRIKASLKLPSAKKKLHLILSDDEDTLHPEYRTQLKDEEAYKATAAFRWIPDIISRVRYSVDVSAHASDVFTRFRAQRSWRLSDNALFYFKQSVRYGVKSELKSVSEFEAERLLNDRTVLRIGSAVQYWQNEPDPVGLRWSQDNSVLYRISRNRSLAYGLTVEGVQQPHWQVRSDRLFLLYRQSIWRSWLYYELEPQLVRDWQTGKDIKSLFVLRLEANFGN